MNGQMINIIDYHIYSLLPYLSYFLGKKNKLAPKYVYDLSNFVDPWPYFWAIPAPFFLGVTEAPPNLYNF